MDDDPKIPISPIFHHSKSIIGDILVQKRFYCGPGTRGSLFKNERDPRGKGFAETGSQGPAEAGQAGRRPSSIFPCKDFQKAGSDIDVVVISDDFSGKSYWERIDILADAIYEIFAPLEAVAMTPDESARGDSFIFDFACDGEVLFDA